jgi:D-arabinose 1-dehydrogenase-like Zn-dependent alcohol dehydrogenase
LRAGRYGGTVAQIGVLSQSEQPLPIPLILHHQVRIQGFYVGSKAHFEAMNRAIGASRMQPVVDQVYAFDKAREALKCMEIGAHFGKTIIRVVA